MSDEFEEIMKGADSKSDSNVVELPADGGLWETLEAVWPKIHEGVLVKGMLILEYQDARGRVLKWETSNNIAEWDLYGLLHSALADLNAKAMADRFSFEGEEEEDEDE